MIVGSMPEQRNGYVLQLYGRWAKAQPEFGGEQASQSRVHGYDDGRARHQGGDR